MKRMLSSFSVVALISYGAFASGQAPSPQPNSGAPAQPAVTQPATTQPAQTAQSQPSDGNQAAPSGDRRFSFDAGAAAKQFQFRSADSELAACLAIDNEGEVFAGQMALQKSQNDEVKKFAQEMVDAHGEMIQKLQKFTAGPASNAAPAGATPDERLRSTDANAINNQTAAAATAPAAGATANGNAAHAQPSTGDTQSMRRGAGALDHVALKRELGEMCKQTLQREWGPKSGMEFDMCYVGQQIGAHLHAIDAMRVAQKHSSDELRQVLNEGIQTAEGHLQHAKDLAKKMESEALSSKR